MTWREDIDNAGQNLAQLLTDGGRVDPIDLDGALSARRVVLDLARAVHLDVTGLGTRSAVPTLAGLHEHPVRTFGQLLVRQPQPAPERALSDIISHRPRSEAGTRWQGLALYATLASHAWSETPAQHRPSGHQAWAALNHVAALVHAVTVLDEDLAVSADRAGRGDLANQMRTAATSGLAEAANVVRALAAAGPLPDLIDPPEPAPRRLMPVPGLDDLTGALTALAEQVHAARHLSPAHTQLEKLSW